MIDQLDLIISKLENMGLDINCPVIEVVIRGKLPVNAVNWIYFEGDGRRAPDWSVKKLLATIRQYAEIRKSAYEVDLSFNRSISILPILVSKKQQSSQTRMYFLQSIGPSDKQMSEIF